MAVGDLGFDLGLANPSPNPNQIAATRAQHQAEASARAREALEAAAAAREHAAAAAAAAETSAADPSTESVAGLTSQPAARDGTAAIAAPLAESQAPALAESALPEHVREEVEAAVAAGRVDEAYMLLSAGRLGSLRSEPAFVALKRELIGRAEANKALKAAARRANAEK